MSDKNWKRRTQRERRMKRKRNKKKIRNEKNNKMGVLAQACTPSYWGR